MLAFGLVCWFRWPLLVLSVSAFWIGMSSVFSRREGRAEQRGGDSQWLIFFSISPRGFQTFMSPPKSIPVAQLVKTQPAVMEFYPWIGKSPWRRERLSTLVFWPGEFHGLYSPWGRKESDKTEQLSHTISIHLSVNHST